METNFNGYALNEKRQMCRVSAPLLNYNNLIKIMLSNQQDSNEVMEFESLVNEHGTMYLDETVKTPKVAFASLMRSGNTFYRKLVEIVTGVASGSNIEIMSSP
jgi:hypothetical protein